MTFDAYLSGGLTMTATRWSMTAIATMATMDDGHKPWQWRPQQWQSQTSFRFYLHETLMSLLWPSLYRVGPKNRTIFERW